MVNLKKKCGVKNTDFVNYSVKITQNWTDVNKEVFGHADFVIRIYSLLRNGNVIYGSSFAMDLYVISTVPRCGSNKNKELPTSTIMSK